MAVDSGRVDNDRRELWRLLGGGRARRLRSARGRTVACADLIDYREGIRARAWGAASGKVSELVTLHGTAFHRETVG